MQLNSQVKRILLSVLMLFSLLLIGCNRPEPEQQLNEIEPMQQVPVIIKETTEPTPKPTIEPISPTPTIESTGEPLLIAKKSERTLELWDGDQLIDSFDIDIGKVPEGDKKVQGDCKTPEGEYYIGYQNPNSHYYLSLGIAYPNKEDAQEALDNGQINQTTYNSIASAIDSGSQPPANTILGGGITVHGRVDDQQWTRGCIAVDNDVMDLLWESCPVGTKIIIYP